MAVPYFMREIIEQMSMAARASKYIDQQSGVSARFSIANYRTMVASARQRAAVLGERPAVPRISDLGHLYSSSLGKLEMDLMSSHQMSERQVLDAIMAEAIRNVFEEYVDQSRAGRNRRGLLPRREDRGGRPAALEPVCRAAQAGAAGLGQGLRGERLDRRGRAGRCVEFVLAGLYATDRISRSQQHGRIAMRSCYEIAVTEVGKLRQSRASRGTLLARTLRGRCRYVTQQNSVAAIGGMIHTYQRYDPGNFPSPTQPPPDVVSGAMEHMLMYGEHAGADRGGVGPRRAARSQPDRRAGAEPGEPDGDAPRAEAEDPGDLRDRPRAGGGRPGRSTSLAEQIETARPELDGPLPPGRQGGATRTKSSGSGIAPATSASPFARQLVQLIDRLGNKYQIDELAAKYEFTGRTRDDHPQGPGDQGGAGGDRPAAEAVGRGGQDGPDRRDRHGGAGRIRRAGRHGEPQRAGPPDRSSTSATWPSSRDWSGPAQGYRLTPKAYRLFQGRLLARIFSNLEASRTGRHQGPVVGEGAVELQQSQALRVRRLAGQPWTSPARWSMPCSATGRACRCACGTDDILVHRNPQHAQVRHGRAPGHERLDALRRPVREREADGPGPGRADPPRVSRRLAAIHRGLHLRQAAAARARSSP